MYGYGQDVYARMKRGLFRRLSRSYDVCGPTHFRRRLCRSPHTPLYLYAIGSPPSPRLFETGLFFYVQILFVPVASPFRKGLCMSVLIVFGRFVSGLRQCQLDQTGKPVHIYICIHGGFSFALRFYSLYIGISFVHFHLAQKLSAAIWRSLLQSAEEVLRLPAGM